MEGAVAFINQQMRGGGGGGCTVYVGMDGIVTVATRENIASIGRVEVRGGDSVGT